MTTKSNRLYITWNHEIYIGDKSMGVKRFINIDSLEGAIAIVSRRNVSNIRSATWYNKDGPIHIVRGGIQKLFNKNNRSTEMLKKQLK